MFSGKRIQRTAHRLLIKRNRNMPVGIAAKRASVTRIPDPVGIGFSGGQKAGVKIRRNLPAFQHADIRRKHGVQNKGIFFRRNRAGRIKMNLLVQRMDAGISPGSAGYRNRMSAGGRKRLLDYLLDSQAVDLPLPAGIGGAVIFHCEQNPLQRNIPSSMTSASSTAITPQAIQSFLVIFSTRRRVRPFPP